MYKGRYHVVLNDNHVVKVLAHRLLKLFFGLSRSASASGWSAVVAHRGRVSANPARPCEDSVSVGVHKARGRVKPVFATVVVQSLAIER